MPSHLAARRVGGAASRAAAAKPSARMPSTKPIAGPMLSPTLPSSLHLHQSQQQQQRRSSPSSSSVVVRASDDDKSTAASAPTAPTPSKFTFIENDKLPLGKPTFDDKTAGAKGAIKFRLAFALPWRRFKSDSVLVLDVAGGIGEKRAGRFAPSALTMPQVRRRREKKVFPLSTRD